MTPVYTVKPHSKQQVSVPDKKNDPVMMSFPLTVKGNTCLVNFLFCKTKEILSLEENLLRKPSSCE